jgi:superfamily II DNA helicase RecQ
MNVKGNIPNTVFFSSFTDTPFLALTGTADETTEIIISDSLGMKNHEKVFVSPNRINLRFSVKKIQKSLMLSQLDWIVDMVKENGIRTPKTIIFCTTLYGVGSVMNYLMMQLGPFAFYPPSSHERMNCLLGIFHSSTLQKYKETLLKSFKEPDGLIRITVATTALSMGVNFPNIRFVVMWGPPRNILDFHQEAGRAGRDDQLSDVILYYYGQQIVHCEEDMQSFLKNDNGCQRVGSYISLDSVIKPLLPGHNCCQYCTKFCDCNDGSCDYQKKAHEIEKPLVEEDNSTQSYHRNR